MSDRWYFRHRQEWIAQTVRIFGFINRKHLERKFEISKPQASADLAYFQQHNPGVIEYNKTTKRFEDCERIADAMEARESFNAMVEKLQNLCDDFGCLGGSNRIDWLRSRLERLREIETPPAHLSQKN